MDESAEDEIEEQDSDEERDFWEKERDIRGEYER